MTFDTLLPDGTLAFLIAQTSVWLLAGVAVSAVSAMRPARRHRLLLLAIAGALVTPVLTIAIGQLGWGVLPAPVSDAAPLAAAPPPIGAETAPRPSFLLTPITILVALWCVMSVALLIRLSGCTFRARRLAATGESPGGDRVADLMHRVCVTLGVRRAPEIIESDYVRGPVIWCWSRRPRVLVPTGETMRLDDDRLFDVLCHEVAHWKRRDHLSSLLAELAVCALPWNPLAWIARRRLRSLSEQACDGWALAAGAAPTRYAETLLGLIPEPKPALVLAAVSGRSAVAIRIDHILRPTRWSPRCGSIFCIAAAGVTVLLTAGVAFAQRRPPLLEPPLLVAIHPGPDELPDAAALRALDVAGAPTDLVVATPLELDLGVCAPGAVKTGRIWLVNRSASESTRVDSAKASCGCTTVGGFEPTLLPPRGSMSLEIAMTAPDKHGQRKKKFVTFTIDGQPPLRLPILLETEPAPS